MASYSSDDPLAEIDAILAERLAAPFSPDEHKAWARRRKLAQQRWRRSRLRRIDYYASPEADRFIDELRGSGIGHDASTIINRAVVEFWERQHALRRSGFRNKVGQKKTPAEGVQ